MATGRTAWSLILTAVLVSVIGWGCSSAAPAPKPAASPASSTAPAASSAPSTAQAWMAELQALEEAAQKEGKVTVYTAADPVQSSALTDAWKKKYPKIEIEFLYSTGNELTERILQEQKTKAYTADLAYAGSSRLIDHKKSELAVAYTPPELKNPAAKWSFDMDLPIKAYGAVAHELNPRPILINTRLVKAEDEPKTYNDLLNPKWKKKIALNDPTGRGPGQGWWYFITEAMGEEWLKKFAAQEPIIVADWHEVSRGVARGEYPLAVTAGAEDIPQLKGAPIKFLFMPEGEWATFLAFHLVVNAPHPNAGKLFLNFIISEEGQKTLAATGAGPVRLGVPLLEPSLSMEGKKIRPVYTPEDTQKMKDLQPGAGKILGLK